MAGKKGDSTPRRAWGMPVDDVQPASTPIETKDAEPAQADTGTVRLACSPNVIVEENKARETVPEPVHRENQRFSNKTKKAKLAPVNPRTGEPRRPVVVWAAAVCQTLAVVSLGVSLALTYYVAVFVFDQASWLMHAFDPGIGTLGRVLLAVGVTAAALVAAIASVIAGYHAWAGYRWSRIASLIAWLVSSLALLLNIYALPAIALTAIATVLVWLPPAGRFFTAWQVRRHPVPRFSPPFEHVFYGPLPRYRTS